MLSALFTKAKVVFQTEGLVPVLSRGLRLLVPYIFRYDTYYLYQHTMKERNEADFMPKIQDFTFKIVSTNQQADKLAADGFDLLLDTTDARRKLEEGAIAFCVFVEGKLAHIGWVAMSEKAKNTFDSLPYQVDFSSKQACTGGTRTYPGYEGNGLMAYGYFKRLQFLKEMGITVSRNAVETSNIASQKAHAKFGPKIYAKGRYLKILRWKLWNEKPLV